MVTQEGEKGQSGGGILPGDSRGSGSVQVCRCSRAAGKSRFFFVPGGDCPGACEQARYFRYIREHCGDAGNGEEAAIYEEWNAMQKLGCVRAFHLFSVFSSFLYGCFTDFQYCERRLFKLALQTENALVLVVHAAKAELRAGMSLCGGFLIPLSGYVVVLRHALAGVVLYAEVVPVFRVISCGVLLIRLGDWSRPVSAVRRIRCRILLCRAVLFRICNSRSWGFPYESLLKGAAFPSGLFPASEHGRAAVKAEVFFADDDRTVAHAVETISLLRTSLS